MTKSGFDLDEIERLLAAATPGKWRTCALDQEAQIWCGSNYIGKTRDYTGDDAALIVALHNSAPAMIAAIRELRAENARLRLKWAELHNTCNVVGSPYYEALQAVDRLVSHVRTFARAALGEPQ